VATSSEAIDWGAVIDNSGRGSILASIIIVDPFKCKFMGLSLLF